MFLLYNARIVIISIFLLYNAGIVIISLFLIIAIAINLLYSLSFPTSYIARDKMTADP